MMSTTARPQTQSGPGPTRILRVDTVLTASAPFAPFVSRRSERVRKPNGTEIRVSEKVVAAAKYLHDKGIDACNALKDDILRAGCAVTGIEPHKVIRARAKPKPAPVTPVPSETRIRRVHATLRNSTLRPLFSAEGVEISSPRGPEIVMVDAYEIAITIHKEGRDACALSREDIYGAAIRYLVEVKKVPESSITQPVAKLPSGNAAPLKVVTKIDKAPAPVPIVGEQEEEPSLEEEADEATVDRLETILAEDTDTAERVKDRSVVMRRHRDGALVKHSRFAFDLTLTLTSEQQDPSTMPKKRVLQAAKNHLLAPGNNGSGQAHRKKVPMALPIYSLLIGALQVAQEDKMPGADARRKLVEDAANAYWAYTDYESYQ